MRPIRKKIVTDENSQPVAVQIVWADWLEIEQSLGSPIRAGKAASLSSYAGSISLTEEPLAFQTRLRAEWL